ncbi:MAG: hypothetical protein EOO77_11165, partial [Oxalobacteraceae bacterium]
AAVYLAQLLDSVIANTVPAARDARNWLETTASALTAANLPLRWTSPSGLPSMQRHQKILSRRVTIVFRGRKIELALPDDDRPDDWGGWRSRCSDTVVEIHSSQKGIASDFIHSLDAAHGMAVARHCARDEGARKRSAFGADHALSRRRGLAQPRPRRTPRGGVDPAAPCQEARP